MAAAVVRLKTHNGQDVAFVNEVKGQGGMKDVYFSPNKDYVVAFFRDRQDPVARERLIQITDAYRDRIYNQEGGAYWKDLYCFSDCMDSISDKMEPKEGWAKKTTNTIPC